MGEGYEKGEQRMGDMKWEIKKKHGGFQLERRGGRSIQKDKDRGRTNNTKIAG